MESKPPSQPSPEFQGPVRPSTHGLKWPVRGIFLILLLHTLVWASDFLIPVTAAFLGYLVLNRPRRLLARIGVPSPISAALFTGLMGVGLAVVAFQLSTPAAEMMRDLPEMVKQINEKVNATGGPIEALNEATKAAKDIVDEDEEKPVEVTVVSDAGVVGTIMSMAPSFASQVLMALILLFFLVASGDLFLTKTVQSLRRFRDKRKAVAVLHTIEDRLGHYLGGIALINAGLGVSIGIAMMLWNMPGAILFGLMGFALNFVPYLGGLLGACIAAAVAFISLDGLWPTAGVFITYILLTSIEGQFVTPMVISRRMRLNTTVVFLTVAFFAWIWSVIGMIVALPVLIVIKIACDEMENMQTLARFLGDFASEPVHDDSEKQPRESTPT